MLPQPVINFYFYPIKSDFPYHQSAQVLFLPDYKGGNFVRVQYASLCATGSSIINTLVPPAGSECVMCGLWCVWAFEVVMRQLRVLLVSCAQASWKESGCEDNQKR